MLGQSDIDRKAVVEAATKVGAHAFICTLPKGYDTIIGEGGVQLSGGQAQRIAIARALLKNPHILILDEATNALDNSAEAHILQSVLTHMKRYTVIMITHKRENLHYMDVCYDINVKAEIPITA